MSRFCSQRPTLVCWSRCAARDFARSSRDCWKARTVGLYDRRTSASDAIHWAAKGYRVFTHLLMRRSTKGGQGVVPRLSVLLENLSAPCHMQAAPSATAKMSPVEGAFNRTKAQLRLALEKEDAARFEQFKTEIRTLLAKDKPLLRLFDCFCAEISRPIEQARKLKVPVRHIQDLQRRLRRKLAAHGYVPSSWKTRIRVNYFSSQPSPYQSLAKAA